MQVKRKGKQPMIWTGDLPAKHFQARPVDLSVEFEIDAVKWLEDMEGWWKKYEKSFWARFVPLMSKELKGIETQVLKWDGEFEKLKPEGQKALQAKLGQLTKGMGERLRKESVVYAQAALTETMGKVDREMTKTKVVARTKLGWDIIVAVAGVKAAAVAGPVGWGLLGLSLMKLLKDFQAAQKAYSEAWNSLEEKAKLVHIDTELLKKELESVKRAGKDEKLVKAAVEKARAASKKLKADADTMDVHIISARKFLAEQDRKIAEMEKGLAKTGGKGGTDKAMAVIKDWQASRGKWVADLQDALLVKKGADVMQAKLAAANIGDPGVVMAMAQKVDGAAEKIVKGQDAVEKGKKLAEIIQSIASLMK
jgi:hypothetical protein